MPSRLALVDGTALAYRAFFALPARFRTSTGVPTNASFGFATMFRKLFAGKAPERGAVVFDPAGPTVREARYPGYKAHRPPMPEELAVQLPWIERIVAAHAFPVRRVDGYEADDVIGTLARLGLEAGLEVVVVSGDKELAQLVSDRVRVFDPVRDVTWDAELVRRRWGVRPDQFVDYLALVGDSSGDIPGVPGIGAKGAAGLLARFGSLDEILARVDELSGRPRSALESHRDLAVLSAELARIDREVPVDLSLEELAVAAPEPNRLDALYRELEFYSLLAVAAAPSSVEEAEDDLGVVADLETLDRELARADACEGPPPALLALTAEDGGRGSLVGCALAAVDGRARWIPLEGESGLGREAVERLGAWLSDAARPLATYDVKSLRVAMARRGHRVRGEVADVLLASFLAEPTKIIPHGLDQISREYLHRSLAPLRAVTGGGRGARPLGEVPAAEVGAWAGYRVLAVRALVPVLSERVEALGLTSVLETVDLPLAELLAEMELAGIGVDQEDLAQLGEELRAELVELETEVHRLAGRSFNVGSTKQLGAVLFDELGLPVLRRTKTGYGTDAEVLERLAADHGAEIAARVLEWRSLAKLISTYTDVLVRAADPATGRIHACFQQTVGATGRLITTDPDLQRTPIKGERGRRIRRAFVASPGRRIVSADWSQIELRLLAHVTSDPRLVDAFARGEDIHRMTAADLFSVEPGAVTTAQRRVGKLVNFATLYGQGATALGRILGVPRTEAQAYIDRYFRSMPGVRRWLDETMATAHERGYVETLLGRRRWIPELGSSNPMLRQAGERIAANTPIQGSAADLCKLAMLRVAERLRAEGLEASMCLQVHDELVFDAPAAEVDRLCSIVREQMEHPHPLPEPLAVPLVVEIGVGGSWGEAHG